MKTKLIKLLLLPFLILSFSLVAQTDNNKENSKDDHDKVWWKKGKPYVIILNDGTEYNGEIVGDNDRELLIFTKSMGKLYIPKYAIKSINLLDQTNYANGEFINENYHPNFYMAATNAIPFKPREMRMSMFYFGGFSGTYAINESIMLGVQTTIIGAPASLCLKTSFTVSDKNYIGTDMHIGTMSYIVKSSYVGNISIKYTHGDGTGNVSLIGGIGFASFLQYKYMYNPTTGISTNTAIRTNDNSYYVGACAFKRLTNSSAFVGEAWAAPKSNFGLLGLGIRTMKKTNVSWVFGLYNLIYAYKNYYYQAAGSNNTSVIPIPYFGATFKL